MPIYAKSEMKDMPEACGDCTFPVAYDYGWSFSYCCGASGRDRKDFFGDWEKQPRPDWCPLVEEEP